MADILDQIAAAIQTRTDWRTDAESRLVAQLATISELEAAKGALEDQVTDLLARIAELETPTRSWTPGTYTPTRELVGCTVPLNQLRRVTGNQYIGGGSTEFEDHDVIENVYFEGHITRKDNRPRLFRNCYTRLGRLWENFNGLWTFEDCQLGGLPQGPSKDDGIKGHDFAARRCLVEYCSDGFGIYDTAHSGAARHDVNVTLEANIIGPLHYYAEARPEGSHNDGVQIQGGWNIRIVGNLIVALRASSSETVPGDPRPDSPVINAGIQINHGVSSVGDILIDRNTIDGGRAAINAGAKTGFAPYGPITITDNVVGITTPAESGWDMMLGSPDAEPGTNYTVTGNTKADGTPARIGMW